MGYSTDFSGRLDFTEEPQMETIAYLTKTLGEDMREIEEYKNSGLTWLDLEVTEDGRGLQWNGSEKTYDLVDKVNVLLAHLKTIQPGISLTGYLDARGESMEDIWRLDMVGGVAVQKMGRIVYE